MSEYKVDGDTVYVRAYSFEPWKMLMTGPNAEQYKADMEASDALFEGGSRNDWQALLKRTFPDAKLCNCGEAFFGCKYGCDWARSKTKEAVAAKILGAAVSAAAEQRGD